MEFCYQIACFRDLLFVSFVLLRILQPKTFLLRLGGRKPFPDCAFDMQEHRLFEMEAVR
jgi:hypothetical protein